jgi:hypothetical protein
LSIVWIVFVLWRSRCSFFFWTCYGSLRSSLLLDFIRNCCTVTLHCHCSSLLVVVTFPACRFDLDRWRKKKLPLLLLVIDRLDVENRCKMQRYAVCFCFHPFSSTEVAARTARSPCFFFFFHFGFFLCFSSRLNSVTLCLNSICALL